MIRLHASYAYAFHEFLLVIGVDFVLILGMMYGIGGCKIRQKGVRLVISYYEGSIISVWL